MRVIKFSAPLEGRLYEPKDPFYAAFGPLYSGRWQSRKIEFQVQGLQSTQNQQPEIRSLRRTDMLLEFRSQNLGSSWLYHVLTLRFWANHSWVEIILMVESENWKNVQVLGTSQDESWHCAGSQMTYSCVEMLTSSAFSVAGGPPLPSLSCIWMWAAWSFYPRVPRNIFCVSMCTFNVCFTCVLWCSSYCEALNYWARRLGCSVAQCIAQTYKSDRFESWFLPLYRLLNVSKSL